jgi:hypothetical protein
MHKEAVMNSAEYVGASAEKGWGMFFDMRINGDLVRFSISSETLTTMRRGERTFPEIFERNLATILSAAKLLARSGRLATAPDIGGTEILTAHLKEVANA